MSVSIQQSLDTVYCADSVEWCPVKGFQDILLCGTYQLEETDEEKDEASRAEPQVRVGRIYLHRLHREEGLHLENQSQLDMPGILDIKWSQQSVSGSPSFCLVNSVGQLKMFSLDETGSQVTIVTEEQLGVECLGLSLDWDNTLCERENPRVAASDSTGKIHIFQLSEGGLRPLSSWKAHDYEAWITAFDQWNNNIVYSGGDDCKLKVWDTRLDSSMPVLTSKRHTMGVCSVQSNPVQEYILATGSYDEQLLIWDSRQMRQPITDLGLGGGIWRIKWEPQTAQHILTATMYNGFHVVGAADVLGSPLEVKYHFEEHQSIGYGVDWYRGPCLENQLLCKTEAETQSASSSQDTETLTVASCSFYDHLLKLWCYTDIK